ncbi:selenide, water dikinase SelD [Polyangium sp. 6x1]|uniref:selenide, water dikinase SelD n=1 Tax=Polyangium sp. 6x1 TaxID=3042689 RepID=UPI002482D3E4|nr:selenide, water dikinase SelD [Polyangium sp. 6x1]MDI1447373.1 selenide, water dikinase SelD [Polyangium sp. 6x1]
MTVRLTQVAKRAGCAAKHPPGYLFPLLRGLPPITDPNVMIGTSTADDAAVYRLSADTALVLTTDFFTPVVDDPYDFGAVAATNALSDVYAMGGKPLTALNLVGFPDDTLDASILAEILRGGAEKAREAGIDLVGGHTIKTDEPIYGLAVTGVVHPDRVVSNAGGRPGDLLVLTKPLGIGILTTAAKQNKDALGAIGKAIRLMSTLNRGACEAMTAIGAHAATDVTGFGLLGHLRNVVAASGCGATVWLDAVPVVEEAWTYVKEGIAPGGTHANWRFLKDHVSYEDGIDKPAELVLSDAQTSGGLLIAVEPSRVDALIAELEARGTPARAIVGRLDDGPAGKIRVTARATG